MACGTGIAGGGGAGEALGIGTGWGTGAGGAGVSTGGGGGVWARAPRAVFMPLKTSRPARTAPPSPPQNTTGESGARTLGMRPGAASRTSLDACPTDFDRFAAILTSARTNGAFPGPGWSRDAGSRR